MSLLLIKGYQIERFIGYTIAILLAAFLIFLLIRQIVCWYWKINERTNLLYDIRGLLTRLVEINEVRIESNIKEDSVDDLNENYHQNEK